jgi:pilus assembly protein Flp/PilA
LLKTLVAMLRNEDGQGLVEYALIIALIAVVAITALRLIGTNASRKLTSAGTALS